MEQAKDKDVQDEEEDIQDEERGMMWINLSIIFFAFIFVEALLDKDYADSIETGVCFLVLLYVRLAAAPKEENESAVRRRGAAAQRKESPVERK